MRLYCLIISWLAFFRNCRPLSGLVSVALISNHGDFEKVHALVNIMQASVNIIDGKGLNLLLSTQDIAKLLPKIVRNPTDFVMDGHVTDGENQIERAFRATLRPDINH